MMSDEVRKKWEFGCDEGGAENFFIFVDITDEK